ncbi:hypothetical protein KIW84_020862 [Lathyrus oleraceus]|uniref:quinolinate synthase n=1 Tax=Pisum sativum TaxID=3888 RepID=A0A9D4Y6Q4_PEA|nr:hypothetical protein KIW84_020862 [Pisum sativum]
MTLGASKIPIVTTLSGQLQKQSDKSSILDGCHAHGKTGIVAAKTIYDVSQGGEKGYVGSKIFSTEGVVAVLWEQLRIGLKMEIDSPQEEARQVANESPGNQQGAVGESNLQINCSDSDQGGLIELEKLLKQKTFTRSEIDHLTALMQSRTVDAPIRGGRRLKLKRLLELNMAKAGCKSITVLGVDFMSENVRAILDQAGFNEVDVYRMSNERIGCSLADAAATSTYMEYLEPTSRSTSLHVIYINTKLETKAYAHELVPTITCTSSNVIQTILQAFAQVPDLSIYYGPDSYMGANIDGSCIVHHLFGHEVVDSIKEMYCDAFLTAHLEVPGEMFSLAMEAKRRGMGVVGSTQNILDFIKDRVQESLDRNIDDHLQFVLGTESGMVTAIVAVVCSLLEPAKSSSHGAKVTVEIMFPVSSDSISKTTSSLNSVEVSDIIPPVVPGVTSGEGCSIHGGCASCPYMKMNSLSSLLTVCHHLPDEENMLSAYKAE